MKAAFLSALFLGTLAHASSITFNFGSPTGNQGVSHTYMDTSSTYSVAATAFGPCSGCTTDLFGKSAGGDEVGLGLTNDPSHDNEITVGSFVQLNISAISGFDPLTITMGSTTGGEGWKIWQTNTAGTLSGATLVLSGSDESGHSISPGDTYLDITAYGSGANMLLKSITFDDGKIPTQEIPEPASLGMMGAGIGIFGFLARRAKLAR